MQYIILDLEATCWEKGTNPARMEVIEIGAVKLPPSQELPVAEFARFVKPINEPILSTFCTQLTSIRQEDVDLADRFDIVFPAFLEWIDSTPFVLCSWGAYDLRQLKTDCERHRLAFPSTLEHHINLKAAFADWKQIKPCGMKTALTLLKMPLLGTHHRGIDDARNIAQIAHVVLPYFGARKGI